jgi:hypothetical protein
LFAEPRALQFEQRFHQLASFHARRFLGDRVDRVN